MCSHIMTQEEERFLKPCQNLIFKFVSLCVSGLSQKTLHQSPELHSGLTMNTYARLSRQPEVTEPAPVML